MSNSPIQISSVIEGGTTEVRWFTDKVNPLGYLLIHEDGTLTVPFRNAKDVPFVFVLGDEGGRVYLTEDQPPCDTDELCWDDWSLYS